MADTAWKYTDESQRAVFRVVGEATQSALVDDPEIVAWLEAGNTPDPADPLPDPGPSQAEQLDALVASGAAALATASTLPEVKAVFAATLAGLGDLFGTGGQA